MGRYLIVLLKCIDRLVVCISALHVGFDSRLTQYFARTKSATCLMNCPMPHSGPERGDSSFAVRAAAQAKKRAQETRDDAAEAVLAGQMVRAVFNLAHMLVKLTFTQAKFKNLAPSISRSHALQIPNFLSPFHICRQTGSTFRGLLSDRRDRCTHAVIE